MEIVEIQKTEITPINNVSSGFSFNGGNPTIVLNLSKTNGLLDLTSLRLNATLEIRGTSANTTVPPNNNGIKGGSTINIEVDQYTGLGALIKQITLSKSDGQEIETIRNYNQMLKVLSVAHSEGDYNTFLQQKYNVSPYNKVMATSLNQDQDISLELLTGLLSMTRAYPLNAMDLQLTIELANDTNVFFGTNAVSDSSKYTLKDVSLSYNVMMPNAEGMLMLQKDVSGDFSYNSLSSIYSIINSSDSTNDFQLSASRVRSVFSFLLPTSRINNYGNNSLGMTMPKNTGNVDATVEAISFKKNGVNYPYDEELNVESESLNTRPQTSLLKEFINSVVLYENLEHSLIRTSNAANEPLLNELLDINGLTPATLKHNVSNDTIYGLGVNMDDVTSVGVDFKQSIYSQRLQSTLDGQIPMSVYTNVVNRNVITYDMNSVVVTN